MPKKKDTAARPDKGVVATGRAMLYSFFAQSLSLPRETFVAAINDGSLLRTVRAALSAAPAAHRKRDWSALDALASVSLDELEEDFTRLFGVAVLCPHYEADYVSNDPFRSVHVISDVTAFYSTFGVEVATGAGERADFIAIELELMNFLCSKQAHAASLKQKENAKLSREAQSKFLREHLGLWAKEFAERLIEVSGRGFYQAIGRLLGEFVDAEMSYLVPADKKKATGVEGAESRLKIVG